LFLLELLRDELSGRRRLADRFTLDEGLYIQPLLGLLDVARGLNRSTFVVDFHFCRAIFLESVHRAATEPPVRVLTSWGLFFI
jgi:hypothetical protein